MTLELPHIPEINREKTIINVRNYFEKEYPKYVDHSSLSASLIQSPDFDSVGSSGTRTNTQENSILTSLNADEFIRATVRCINELQEPYKTILYQVYVQGFSNKIVALNMNYHSSRYSDLKNEAFIKFGAKFKRFYDLNSYKNEKSATFRKVIGQ